jgi:hypothetical protein
MQLEFVVIDGFNLGHILFILGRILFDLERSGDVGPDGDLLLQPEPVRDRFAEGRAGAGREAGHPA